MLRLERIESLELPELLPYRTMRFQEEHWRQGMFVAEGPKVVIRLLESNLHVLSVLTPEKWLPQLSPLIESKPELITAYLAAKNVLEKLTGFSMYQGVLALAQIPEFPSLQEILSRAVVPRLFVAVDGVSSAENLGGLARNCGAFGAQALIVGETCCSPYLRRAVRSSMGSIFRLPVLASAFLIETLKSLKSEGIKCIAAHPHTDRQTLAASNLRNDICLVFGSEGDGISSGVLAACDEMAAIPMHDQVDSLNVGAAAAVFLYEAVRQRSWADLNEPGRLPEPTPYQNGRA